jgi:hypothetical protein
MAMVPHVIPDEEMPRLFALIGGADSVELKMTVADEQQSSVVGAFGLDPLEAQIRQVFFFDTPDLALSQHGVVVRARRVQKRRDDVVVKLRPVVPDELPKNVRNSPAFTVEVDAIPGGFVCSGAMKSMVDGDSVREAVSGKRPLRKLFAKEQRALYDANAPEGITFADLSVLGPVFVLKLKQVPKGWNRFLVAELWLYPDGSRILELSTKCAPGEAFQVAAESRMFLVEHGLDLSGEQQTKTRKALEFFTERMRIEAPA